MKEGFDKEIDSFLRRRASRGAAKPFVDGDGAAVSTHAPSHLDADELGAFAEGALPAPARVSAASHLADCDECRGAVVALSRALGGAVESKKLGAVAAPLVTESAKPSGLRAWAAWLFSPRGMRLAVPVLALSAVAVVSYVAVRTRDAGAPANVTSGRGQTAANKERTNAAAPETNGAANANIEGLIAQGPDAQSNINAAPPGAQPQAPVTRGHGAAGEAQPSDSVAAADVAAPPPPASASAAPAQPAGPTEIAKSATAPRPVAEESEQQPAKSEDRPKEKGGRGYETADELAAADLANQQRRAAQSRAANEMPDGAARNQKRAADNNASNIYGGATAGTRSSKDADRESKSDAAAAPARRGRATTRAERRDGEDDETMRVSETRTAAGRRFRREGNAWVDVNYKSSMASTGVRRGTEAFRALVADHPEIGRVAEQLGGEVVVVVRGRAYRIR